MAWTAEAGEVVAICRIDSEEPRVSLLSATLSLHASLRGVLLHKSGTLIYGIVPCPEGRFFGLTLITGSSCTVSAAPT